MNPSPTLPEEQEAWNEAYRRASDFLETFSLGDRTHAARLALGFVEQAREAKARGATQPPTTLTMELARKSLTDWLATNLDRTGKAPSEILADGSIALLLSRVFRTAPSSFLAGAAAGGTSPGAAGKAPRRRAGPECLQHDAAPARLRADAPDRPPDVAPLGCQGTHYRFDFLGGRLRRSFLLVLQLMSAPTIAPTADFPLRRILFVGLSTLLTVVGCILMYNTLAAEKMFWEDYVALGIFPLLFSQIAVGFVLALFGFFDQLRGGDSHHVMHRPWRKNEQSVPLAATAIVIPVYNENVDRISRAIANMWHSVEKTGHLDHFDFFICSDSNDADHWIEEECAWMSLCQKLNAFGKIFYRKRRHRLNGKSGNVADFCRRWGKRYRYMIVLDADSIMAGATLVRMVRAMEANPEVGILQTQPYMVLGRSLFRRVLQFSSHVYGGLFSQGCSMTQMSSASYWGHNAIIRTAPFIEHCDLPLLPVPDPGKRHVLSHDTVEAALMRRAGYGVWIAYDEPGSYEEGPPNLSDMLIRDRRWCAGNLQHLWFLFARGIEMGSRLQIWIGLMGYLCSPLWLAFLLAGSFGEYFRQRFLLFSADLDDLNAVGNSDAFSLFLLTLILLFLPRVLGVVTSLKRAREFGGAVPLLVGALLENLLSILMAPVLMMFHTFFVLSTILGLQIKWTTQNRTDSGLSFSHCLNWYGWLTVLGLVTGPLAFFYLGHEAWWLTPIFSGWILAPLLAWLTSGTRLGLAMKRWRLFLTPEETNPPEELHGLDEDDESGEPEEHATSPLWVQALLVPYVQAVHVSMVRQGASGSADAPLESLATVRENLLREGPGILSGPEKLRLLWDAETVFWMHHELWSRPSAQLHPSWIRYQRETGASPLLSNYLIGS